MTDLNLSDENMNLADDLLMEPLNEHAHDEGLVEQADNLLANMLDIEGSKDPGAQVANSSYFVEE